MLTVAGFRTRRIHRFRRIPFIPPSHALYHTTSYTCNRRLCRNCFGAPTASTCCRSGVRSNPLGPRRLRRAGARPSIVNFHSNGGCSTRRGGTASGLRHRRRHTGLTWRPHARLTSASPRRARKRRCRRHSPRLSMCCPRQSGEATQEQRKGPGRHLESASRPTGGVGHRHSILITLGETSFDRYNKPRVATLATRSHCAPKHPVFGPNHEVVKTRWPIARGARPRREGREMDDGRLLLVYL